MEKGNFRPLTQHDVEVAEAEDYLFNLPVQTDWTKLDQGMLSRFYERHGFRPSDMQPLRLHLS